MTNLYLAMGGSDKIHQLTKRFLQKVMADDLLGEMFAGKVDHAAHIASYFEGNFGGPGDYFRDRGDLRFLLARHANLKITEPQRRRWVELMSLSAAEVGMPDQALNVFSRYLDGPSRHTTAFSNLPEGQALAQLGYQDRPDPLHTTVVVTPRPCVSDSKPMPTKDNSDD